MVRKQTKLGESSSADTESGTTTMSTSADGEKPVNPDPDEVKKEKPVRKRRRVFGEKICQVCGDKALAHHFGTLACETCKAFFRRNASIKEPRKCLFKGDCPITVKTRRFCPACRLAKCFRVGMRPDLILDEDEKKERMQKVNEKRSLKESRKLSEELDKSGCNMIHSPNCAVTTTAREIACSPDQTASLVDQAWRTASEINAAELAVLRSPASFSQEGSCIQEGQSIEAGQNVEIVLSGAETLAAVGQDSKMAVFSGSQNPIPSPVVHFSEPLAPAASAPYPTEMWQTPPSTSVPATSQSEDYDLSLIPSASLVAQSQVIRTFQHVPRDELPSDPYMYWRLSEEERCLLTQLSAAYQDTLLSVLKGSPPREVIKSQLITPQMYLEECELEARNVISFSKRMEDFRQLRQDEQIALLKASTCQTLGIQSCALYIAEKEAWLTRMGYFTVEHCKMLLPNHPLSDPALNYCRSVKSIVKNDVTLYALLHCVVLFDPCDERVIDRQLINSIRDKYIILLRHYLESVYSYRHSEKYMMALQENLIFYRNLCREGKPLVKKFFPSIPNKLLVEVMDLE